MVSDSRTNTTANDVIKDRCAKLLAHSGLVAVSRPDLDDPYFCDKVVILDGDEGDTGIDNQFEYPARLLNSANFTAFFDGIKVRKRPPNKSNEGQSPSLLSLDVVDVPLYKTLLQHPELLRTLHWRTFEKLLADVLDSFGYEIELQRGTKDGGIDIFALKKSDAFGTQRFLVQAKRWSNKVGVEPVQQLSFLHNYHKVTKSCLATTAAFTRGAWELADQYQWQLELRDFDGIQEWLHIAAQKRQIV